MVTLRHQGINQRSSDCLASQSCSLLDGGHLDRADMKQRVGLLNRGLGSHHPHHGQQQHYYKYKYPLHLQMQSNTFFAFYAILIYEDKADKKRVE